jgi:hypothetical protein
VATPLSGNFVNAINASLTPAVVVPLPGPEPVHHSWRRRQTGADLAAVNTDAELRIASGLFDGELGSGTQTHMGTARELLRSVISTSTGFLISGHWRRYDRPPVTSGLPR